MNIRTLVTLLLLGYTSAAAQPLRFEKIFRIDDYSASADAMRPTSDGGYIIAGRFSVYDTTRSEVPDTRALLLRIDSAGTVLWYRMYGASHINYLVSVHQTSDGGFVACGVSDGTYNGKKGWKDHWLLRTDANGDTLWTRQYGTPQHDELAGMLLLPGGDFLLYGMKDSDDRRGYLARTDPEGEIRWKQEYKRPGGIFDLIATRNGGYAFATAATLYRIDSVGTQLHDTTYSRFARIYQLLETSSGGFLLAGDRPGDPFALMIAGVDARGNWLWSSVNGQMRCAFANMSIQETRDRGFIIVGHEASGNDQPLVVKTDIVGKELWTRLYHTNQAGPQSAFDVVEITPGDDLILAGYHWWAYDKKESGGVPISRTDSEGWIVRPADDSFWKRLRYVGGDEVAAITFDSAGTMLVAEVSRNSRSLLYRSTDDGSTWQDNGGPGYHYESMLTLSNGEIVAIRARDAVALVPEASGGWRSSDGGLTWARLENFPTTYTFSLTLAPGGDLYALGYLGLFRSSDNGAQWDSLPLPRNDLRGLGVAPGGSLYMVTDSGGTLRSTDRGATWISIGPDNVAGGIGRLGSVAVRGDRELFVTTNLDEATFHTTDDGTTWRRIDSVTLPRIRAFAFAKDRSIYASCTVSGAKAGTYRSTDDGRTWARLGDSTLALRPLVFDLKGRLMGGGDGVFRASPTIAGAAAREPAALASASLDVVPNPASGVATLRYVLPIGGYVTIKVVDRLGRDVARLVEGEQGAGAFRIEWEADRLDDGVYYCVLQSGDEVRTVSVALIR